MKKTIGTKIKEFLDKNNLTQSELSNLSDITQAALSQWINIPDKTPSVPGAIALAEAMNCSLDYLLRDDWLYDKTASIISSERNEFCNIPLLSRKELERFNHIFTKEGNNFDSDMSFFLIDKHFLNTLINNKQIEVKNLFLVKCSDENAVNINIGELALVEKRDALLMKNGDICFFKAKNNFLFREVKRNPSSITYISHSLKKQLLTQKDIQAVYGCLIRAIPNTILS